MLIVREIEAQIHDAATEYPVIAILGPRYAGKTTLVQIGLKRQCWGENQLLILLKK